MPAAHSTHYSRGSNGVMNDLANVPARDAAALSPADFVLHVRDGATWSPAPAAAVSVRAGAGPGSATRVTLTLPDYAVRNTWLRATVKGTLNTGLASDDVFYFGNLVGDTGGAGTPRVDVIDLACTRMNLGRTTPAALAQSDFNRDGRVNAVDVGIVRSNQRRSLPLFTAPAASAALDTASFRQRPVAISSARLAPLPPRRGVWDEVAPELLD